MTQTRELNAQELNAVDTHRILCALRNERNAFLESAETHEKHNDLAVAESFQDEADAYTRLMNFFSTDLPF